MLHWWVRGGKTAEEASEGKRQEASYEGWRGV
jgi:hypothetical protein